MQQTPSRRTPHESILSQQFFHDMTMYIGQPEVPSLISISQLGVINTHQVHHGRIHIVNMDRARREFVHRWIDNLAILVHDVVTIVVGLAIGDSRLNSAACHPACKASWVMVSAVVVP